MFITSIRENQKSPGLYSKKLERERAVAKGREGRGAPCGYAIWQQGRAITSGRKTEIK